MIKEGQSKKAKYWGKFTVEKVINLKEPVKCHSNVRGPATFNPALVKIKWETAPRKSQYEFWLPYWIAFGDKKERYGQYSPMMDEEILLELLSGGIQQDFFSREFLIRLSTIIMNQLKNKN